MASANRINVAMDKMHSSLLCAAIQTRTKTADELVTSFTAAKLAGRYIAPEHEELIQNEILKRRRNEVSRDEGLADLAPELIPAASSERPERLETDRPSD